MNDTVTVAPTLPQGTPVLSRFEFWPGWLFYAPVAAMILFLAIRHRGLTLPSAANPYFEAGGLCGESKSQIVSILPDTLGALVPKWTVARRGPDVALTTAEALKCMRAAKLDFPVVAKPDIGCRAAGVMRLYNERDLTRYIARFPLAERFMLQELCDLPMEAGLFYVRRPDEDRGAIISLTLKYFPTVTGDGVRTLKALILDDPRAGRLAHLYLPRHAARWNEVPGVGETRRIAFIGNHAKGAIFRDGGEAISQDMQNNWERIARQIPSFHFGRLDIRCESLEALARGEGRIVEINGAGSEMTHIWDPRMTLLGAWRALWLQWSLAFEIGDDNRRRGHKPDSILHLLGLWAKERALIRLYPPTE